MSQSADHVNLVTGDGWPPVRSTPRKIFISHASEDTEIAFAIASLLKRYLDLDAFVELGFLRAGTDWTADIARRIRQSELVIVLQSRVVAAGAAPGVAAEVSAARAFNIPVILGAIRGFRPTGDEQYIDFGEEGRRIEGIWGVARYLLSESHHFRVLGLDSIQINAGAATAVLGSVEQIAARSEDVLVLGHTMKQWLSDYGNAIRHASASIAMYFPARDAIGMDLLIASHRIGGKLFEQISKAKEVALSLERELGDRARFQCFTVPIKPMFSAMLVNQARGDAIISIDHYSFKVGAESRPRMIIQGSATPLFSYYSSVVHSVIANAAPLADEAG